MSGSDVSMQTDAPTMLVIGLLVGCCIVCDNGVLIHHRCFQQAPRSATAP